MGLASIEPVELVGCACDGYALVDALIGSRAQKVGAVLIDAAVLDEVDPGLVAALAERARGVGIDLGELASDDRQKREQACDHTVVLAKRDECADAVDRAWLGIAMPGAGRAVLNVAMAQATSNSAENALVQIVDELIGLRRA